MMYRFIILAIFLSTFATAQTKSPAVKTMPGKNNKTVKKDSVKIVQPVKDDPIVIPRNFSVYSRRSKTGKERMKLCVNLVKDTSILNYCITDSLCKDPEVFKVLFEQQEGDTNYVLVYIDAFSKPDDKPLCDAGHETKLFFARWNLKTNKAIWKQKTIASCMRAIDNMTKEPVTDWDKSSVLTINYYRGNSQFVELKFDPNNYKAGFQNGGVAESK